MEKSKAQRLAAALDLVWTGGLAPEAAAELRRLDALNAELVEALGDIHDLLEKGFSMSARMELEALLAKAKEQT